MFRRHATPSRISLMRRRAARRRRYCAECGRPLRGPPRAHPGQCGRCHRCATRHLTTDNLKGETE